MAGTVSAQLLAFLASPLISRLFSPTDFGSFTVIVATATAITSMVTLRIELAIPLPSDESLTYSLFHVAALWCGAFTIVASPLLYAANAFANFSIGPRDIASLTWTIPILASTMGMYMVLNAIAIRQRRYAAISRRNILQATFTVLFQLAAGWVGARTVGLVAAVIFGQLIGASSLLVGARLRSPDAVRARSRDAMLLAFKRYRTFTLALTPAGLLNSLGLQAGVLLLSACYGLTAAGWFGLTQRVLALPVALVGQAAAQVYLSEISRSRRDRSGVEQHLFWKTSKLLFLIGLTAAGVLFALGPVMFEIIFGSSWKMSGLMAQALAVSLLGQFVASPVSQTLIVLELAGRQLAWDILRLSAVVVSILVPYATGLSALTAVWMYSIASFSAYCISWEMSRRALKRSIIRNRTSPVIKSSAFFREVFRSGWPKAAFTPGRPRTVPDTAMRFSLGALALLLLGSVGYIKGTPLIAGLPIDATFSSALLVGILVFDRAVSHPRSLRGSWLLVALWAFVVLAVRFDSPYSQTKSIYALTLIPLAAFGGVVLLSNLRSRYWFVLGTIFFAMAMGVLAIFYPSGLPGAAGRLALQGNDTIGAGRGFGAATVSLVAVAMCRSGKVRIAALVLAVAAAAATAESGSRGPSIAALLALVVMMVRGGGKRAFGWILTLGSVGAGAAWFAFSHGLLPKRLLTTDDASAQARPILRDQAMRLIPSHPTGLGWGGLAEHLTLPAQTTSGTVVVYPHNAILEITAEAGWCAGFLFLAAIGIALTRQWKSGRSVAETGLLGLLIFSVVNAMVSGGINDNRMMWISIGAGLCALPADRQCSKTRPAHRRPSRNSGVRLGASSG